MSPKDQSPNKHEIAEDIASGKEAGRYKDCINLVIGVSSDTYHTKCIEDSLMNPPFRNLEPPECPCDCHFFKDRVQAEEDDLRKIRREKKLQWVKWLTSPFPIFFAWFSIQSWQIQGLIFLALLALFAPRLLPPLTEFVRALWGK